MNLPKPNKINAEKYVAGLTSFNKELLKLNFLQTSLRLDLVQRQSKNITRFRKI